MTKKTEKIITFCLIGLIVALGTIWVMGIIKTIRLRKFNKRFAEIFDETFCNKLFSLNREQLYNFIKVAQLSKADGDYLIGEIENMSDKEIKEFCKEYSTE